MSTARYTERDLAAWLDSVASPARPAYVDELLGLTAATRQHPSWLPERWLPMQFTARTGALVPLPRIPRELLVAALLGVAVVASLVLYVGARADFPAPLDGPARNGLLAFGQHGDILALDPRTETVRMLLGGPERDRGPVFSSDGERLAFERSVGTGWAVFVTAVPRGDRIADPRPITALVDPLVSVEHMVWAPDGRHLVFISPEGGGRRVWVAAADGSGARRLDFGVQAFDFAVHPDGAEIVIKGWSATTQYGLWLVGIDGSDARLVTTPGSRAGWDYAMPAYTPDGRIVTQHAEHVLDEDYHIVVLTLDGERRRVVESTDLTPTVPMAAVGVRLSPDAERVVFTMDTPEHGAGAVRFGLAPLDGSTDATAVGPVHFDVERDARWTPDGRSLLVMPVSGDGLALLDPSAGTTRPVPVTGALEPDWQRRAP